MDEIIKEIIERRDRALVDLKEISNIDVNSYGAGYEAGSVNVLDELLETIEEIMDVL